jgi:hypothetical protein
MRPLVSPLLRYLPQNLRRVSSRNLWPARCCLLLFALSLAAPLAAWALDGPKTFATPEEAASALAAGVKAQDGAALRSIFGPDAADIQNPDRVQATNEFSAFSAALADSFRVTHYSATKCVLEIGTNSWPFPIPIVQREGRWLFDTAAGKEELLNRRIGGNELAVLEVMRAYVDAQREYASRDHDGDGVLEYAQKLSSSPGTQDGLYWSPYVWGEISPLGPFVAEAQGAGYNLGSRRDETPPEPFHGYYFKILTQQGRHAPGGKYDYIINGNMIAGFAMVAWPAGYGDSGIMTFIVNQQGVVYQKDLGAKTGKLAPAMKAYDPDATWMRSPD